MSLTADTARTRVQAARNIQNKRFLNNGSFDIVFNVDVRVWDARQFCKLQDEGGLSLSKHQSLMRAAMSQLQLSASAYHRILKLARPSRIWRGVRKFNLHI